jgi:predicted acylesterase/phospholipase RssA
VFPPVSVDGGTFVDGGVSSHVPLLPARDLGAQTMVVLDTGFP